MHAPNHQVHTPLRCSDGQNLRSDNISILSRGHQCFQSFFCVKCNVLDTAIHSIPHLPLKHELDQSLTLNGTIKAISHLQCRKAADVEDIPPEIRKLGSQRLHFKLYYLLVCCWMQGKLPHDFHDSINIGLFTNKCEKYDCSIYRIFAILSIARKLLARFLLNMLIPAIADENIPEIQCGFRANRGTTNIVFIIRHLQKNAKNKQGTLCYFCRPHKSHRLCEHHRIMNYQETTWLSKKISTDGEPAA